MKQARGSTRKLLIAIGEIQTRVGMARQYHYNDRDRGAFEKGQELLREAFDLCVSATSDYAPVDTPPNKRVQRM